MSNSAIEQVSRLRAKGKSHKQIALTVGISKAKVARIAGALDRAADAKRERQEAKAAHDAYVQGEIDRALTGPVYYRNNGIERTEYSSDAADPIILHRDKISGIPCELRHVLPSGRVDPDYLRDRRRGLTRRARETKAKVA